mgnify:CR=1 FL=1
MLETQRTQFSAQDAVASASADLGIDHVQLFKALGGGWRDAPAATQSAQAQAQTTSRDPRQ